MKGGGALILAALAALLGSKSSGGSTTYTGGYTPLNDTNPVTPPAGNSPFVQMPEPTKTTPVTTPFEQLPLWNNPAPAGGLTGLTIVNVPAPAPEPPAPTKITPMPAKPTGGGISFGGGTSWTWRTPSGNYESRLPTPEELEPGLGCPEVPGIWTYPGQSSQALRYCANPQCLSNVPYWDSGTGETLPPTPAILEQQKDAQGNISYYCRSCNTVQ